MSDLKTAKTAKNCAPQIPLNSILPPAYWPLAGLDETHLVARGSIFLLPEVWQAFDRLARRARDAGFELTVASGYRGFARQQLIWQEKLSGHRPLVGEQGEVLSPNELNEEALLFAILRWSALPGLSRHHWGTDLDVFDAAALSEGERLQLTLQECSGDGIMAPFHQWLGLLIAQDDAEGFFRPFEQDRGGVAEEPWHLSYAPVAETLAARLNHDYFRSLLSSGCWPLNSVIQRHQALIYQRYVEPLVHKTAR